MVKRDFEQMLLNDLKKFFNKNKDMRRTTFGKLVSNNPHLVDKLERLEVNAKTLKKVYAFMDEYSKKELYSCWKSKRDKRGK